MRHSYSSCSYWRTFYAHILLAGYAICIGSILLAVLLPLAPQTPPFTSVIVAAAFAFFFWFVLLEVAISTLPMCFGIWRYVLTAGTPNFSGTYVECPAGDQAIENPATLHITQGWNAIEITFQTGDILFKSITAAIIKSQPNNGDVELIFSFQSSGTNDGKKRVGAHNGTFILKRPWRGNKLDGEYFTESIEDNFKRLTLLRTY